MPVYAQLHALGQLATRRLLPSALMLSHRRTACPVARLCIVFGGNVASSSPKYRRRSRSRDFPVPGHRTGRGGVIAGTSMARGASRCRMTPESVIASSPWRRAPLRMERHPARHSQRRSRRREGRRRESSPWRPSGTGPMGQVLDPCFRGGDTSRAGRRKPRPGASRPRKLVVCAPHSARPVRCHR
jgi:hypothetical protein